MRGIALGLAMLVTILGLHRTHALDTEYYDVLSFNIQFLGHFRDKQHSILAKIMAPYDLVFVQELVAPPYDGSFPDGTTYTADAEAHAFFEAMKAHGFEYVLSPEDTGTGDQIHRNTSATEWWVAFYKPGDISPATDLPNGFLASDRSNNDFYERVPYAFAFRFQNARDLVFVSTHLQPNDSRAAVRRRSVELGAINDFVHANDDAEKDFILLGDMNIKDCDELKAVTPPGFVSLNDKCVPTNTSPRSPKPYDHVMYRPQFSASEIDTDFGLEVINLIEAVRPLWTGTSSFPGDPYDHDEFRTRFSDHHPVHFRIKAGTDDD